VTHFTVFAVIADSSPAVFAVSDLSVSPSRVGIGQQVTISVIVTNTGGLEGTYTVTLEIDGATADARQVTVAGGASEKVTFIDSERTEGTYAVSVDGESGSFTVTTAPPRPARFSVSDLTISPAKAETGDRVSISVRVENTGGQQGSYDVQLKLDGQVVETKGVTLAAGASTMVSFSVTRDVSGTYTMTIGTVSGSFTVEKPAVAAPPEEEEEEPEPEVVTPPEPTNWTPIIIGIIAGVIVLGVLAVIIIRRRQA